MTGNDIIKATGTITKEEEFINIEIFVMPNTLVLESLHPFPGYHGDNLPEMLSPKFYYLATDTKYEGDDILRAAKKVKAKLPYEFNASFGHAEIFPNIIHFIRITDLNCVDCIGLIQEAFKTEGINFMKKRTIGGDALIKIQKLFTFQKIDEYIYRDAENPLMHYFEIPDKPSWPFFRKITFYIRSNVDNYSYDAALGAFYLDEIHDIVRIFGKDLTLSQLNFIRIKYLYELTHPDHLG
jgi:hypothetical protein